MAEKKNGGVSRKNGSVSRKAGGTASKSGMRKGLTAYGDEGFSLFLRKAFIKAMGYTDDALERPIIGIPIPSAASTPVIATCPT